jgi:hypothetical protein
MRVLFPPKFEQNRRHLGENGLCSMHLGMTPGTKRDHQVQQRPAWHPVMHRDRALISPGSSAHPAGVPVAFEHCLAQTAEVRLILPLQGVADRAMAVRHDLRPSAAARQRSLKGFDHNRELGLGLPGVYEC